MHTYLLLYIIPAVSASINIRISGSFQNITVQALGTDKSIITDPERITLNISDRVVKDCIKEYIGRRPDDVFIRSPTPWGDLYKIFGWPEMYRVLKPLSCRVLNVATSPQMLKHEIFENNNNKSRQVDVSQKIFNRFSTVWIKTPTLSVKRINYLVIMDGFNMPYFSPLGQNGEKSKAMTAKVSVNVLGPVIVELYATRVSVKIEILYQASLWGNVIVNFGKSFRGHHFYSPNIDDVMGNCGLTNGLKCKEIIDVGYYTDAKVVVKNKTSGLMVLTRNVEIYPINKEILVI